MARFGGEEFLVLLPDNGLTAAVGIAERLKAAILDLQVAHAGGVVTASFGVASGTISGSSLAALTAAADAALYASKRDGRNRVSTSPANWRAVA